MQASLLPVLDAMAQRVLVSELEVIRGEQSKLTQLETRLLAVRGAGPATCLALPGGALRRAGLRAQPAVHCYLAACLCALHYTTLHNEPRLAPMHAQPSHPPTPTLHPGPLCLQLKEVVDKFLQNDEWMYKLSLNAVAMAAAGRVSRMGSLCQVRAQGVVLVVLCSLQECAPGRRCGCALQDGSNRVGGATFSLEAWGKGGAEHATAQGRLWRFSTAVPPLPPLPCTPAHAPAPHMAADACAWAQPPIEQARQPGRPAWEQLQQLLILLQLTQPRGACGGCPGDVGGVWCKQRRKGGVCLPAGGSADVDAPFKDAAAPAAHQRVRHCLQTI